ncbi:MAG: PfkB family carbohydrate kinase [Lentimonas sp.]
MQVDTMLPDQAQVAEIVVFGEVLYDVLPNRQRVLGGAPFNVAWGLKGLGQDPLLLSAVGNDAEGQRIRERMAAWELSVEGLRTDLVHATGEVYVTIADDEPSYEICSPRAWDSIEDGGIIAEQIVYHGSLALRSAVSAASLSALTARSSARRFFDINLRAPFYSLDLLREWIRGVDWLKLNIDELVLLLEDRSVTFQNCERYVEQLIADFEIENVLLTGGREGALIHGAYGHALCTPAPSPVPFVDTVGAGDSFTAFTIHGITIGMPAEQIVIQASDFAAKVCGLQGATSERKSFYTNHLR